MSLSEDLAIYARTIAGDIEHGASHILKIAAGSLRTALSKNSNAPTKEVHGATREYALRLVSAHRRMAPILNFCNEVLLILQSHDEKDDTVAAKLLQYTLNTSKESSNALENVAAHASRSISGNQFMTHSRSSTLLHFMTKVRDRDDLTIFVTQSRPGAEGRLLAGELSVAGIRTILFEDAEVMRYLDRVSALVVGTDALIPSGIVNKVGTHMISLAAREMGVPVYCLTESIKIWPFDHPILEGMARGAISPLGGMEFFELVPSSMFHAIVLETGPTTFDEIIMGTENVRIAPEISRLVEG
ncbi:MAG TPA: hypothetical protein ENN25_06065 [Euryarchaeota archaeon]|nr:hypothetical protein [Euryarchaeota archaeon]